ncbi:MAG: tRNA (cytidine(56)-2'-O)-methyltransferase [Candidatus Hodarchaeota archaeon]
MPQIRVLRLEYRYQSDRRISTHLGLVARAFGASELLVAGNKRDVAAGREIRLLKETEKLKESLTEVCKVWGGEKFKVNYIPDWKTFLIKEKELGVKIAHLTMFGLPIIEQLKTIKEAQKCNSSWIVVVGGAKVPKKLYQLADFNISITLQPHSEVAALAIFLNKFYDDYWLGIDIPFKDATVKIIPSSKEKITRPKRPDSSF